VRKSSQSPHQFFRNVIEVHVHPEFRRSSLTNDVALLLVDKPVTFGRFVGAACLTGLPGSITDVNFGHKCTAVGWGRTVSTNCKKKDGFKINKRCFRAKRRAFQRQITFRRSLCSPHRVFKITTMISYKYAVDTKPEAKIVVKVS